jgi:hypothetical protein
MSKINCFRAINLNYNNNSMRIEDETFQFDGNSTLLSLQNGGGKSVLVQMMIAPFVRKRYRDTVDRSFASFFTTNRPTFLLTEWVLDGGAGYVLVGLMVRRNQDSEEDTREELDIISFIHEYREPNDFDIHTIPVIEYEGRMKKLKSFHSCKQLFEEMKKAKGLSFQYYDLNQAAQQRRYFEHLKEYQINHTEWEAIIKKVNLKESGLSELFKDAKDEAGLVEKWFLSAVESKLNKEENRMKEFASIIHKFILQYKENQSKIERKETITTFQSDAAVIRESASQFNMARIEMLEYEEKIAFLRSFLMERVEEAAGEKELLEEKLVSLENSLQSVYYEEASYQLYILMDELERLTGEQSIKAEEKEKLQSMIDALTYRLNTMECAGLYQEYKECSAEVLLLENKLDVLKSQEKDLLPERNQLGYNLKCYYEALRNEQKQYLQEQEAILSSKKDELTSISEKEAREQGRAQDLKHALGQLQARIKDFDKEESDFNKRYGKKLERNILRVYEEGSLDVMKVQFSTELEEMQRTLAQLNNKKVQLVENITSCSRDIEDGKVMQGKLRQQHIHQKELLSGYEEQLAVRRVILRFIGLGEEDLFHLATIDDIFERKNKELELAKRTLERRYEELEEEYHRLETGKLLELPKEFHELLDRMDISYLYGMDWLKKNDNPPEVNQALVQQNPMLPYSIIMSDKELKRLSEGQIDFYTSFPIPIIRREDLTAQYQRDISCIYEMDKISFFIVFNQYLLDEEALRSLLVQKQAEIDKVEKLLKLKKDEIAEYKEKHNEIKYQSITKANYQNCIVELNSLEQQIADLEAKLNELRSRKESLQRQQFELSEEMEGYKQREMIAKNQLQDFEQLLNRYQEYLEHRSQFEQSTKELNTLENNISEYKQQLNEINQFLRDAAANRERETIKLEKYQSKANEYQGYQSGELMQKDIEDIEARFEALTKKISEDQIHLEENLKRVKERYDKKLKQLLDKEAIYHLSEPDYKEVKADSYIERETRKQRSSWEEKLQLLQEEINKGNTELAVLENKIKDAYRLLEERLEKSEPLPRSQIIDLEFKKRAKLILVEITKERENLSICTDKIRSYEDNLSNLAEYDHFTTGKDFFFEDELKDTGKSSLKELSRKEFIEFRGRLIRDYRNSCRNKDKKREELQKCLEGILVKKEYEDDYFRRPLDTIQKVANEPQIVLEQLTIILSSFQAQLEKLEVDIAIVEKEQQKVTEMLLDYISEVHKNLARIDRNSTITIRGRSIKMLKIKLPEWEEQESSYQIRLQDFIEELTMRGLQRLNQNENIEEMIGAHVTTKNLYDTIVGIGNVGIKLYKIEAQREYPISWAEVAKNSGGEGFLSAFVVLSSLLSYMRREDTDLFYEKEEGKVLVMDNPFAQTNANHLLKPLMDIARKNNTQLICLSGLGGESIYNRFDNIYVLNLIESGLQKEVQYLKGEHIKGEKPILSIRASQIKVEKMEQMELLF